MSAVVSAEASRDGECTRGFHAELDAGRDGVYRESRRNRAASDGVGRWSEGVRESGGSRERDECPPHLAHAAYTAKGEDAMYSNTS